MEGEGTRGTDTVNCGGSIYPEGMLNFVVWEFQTSGGAK